MEETTAALHATAIKKAEFDDFGDPVYLEALRVLLRGYETDLQLTETGRRFVHGLVLHTLISRLHTQRGWTEHPEVLGPSIHSPLVITGLPRTGTTALLWLLSLDPQFQALQQWLVHTPMIRPPRETWQTYGAYRDCIAGLEAQQSVIEKLNSRMPEQRISAESWAGKSVECSEVLRQTFASDDWLAVPLPTYAQWIQSQRRLVAGTYWRYANVLRLIGANESDKRWLLKAPYHMPAIDALLEVFPDVCVVQIHRDPLLSIPSFCSLIHSTMLQPLEGEDAPHRPALGGWHCAYWRNALNRIQAACRRHPRQFFHVDQRNLLANPLNTIRSMYEYFGLSLSSNTEQQMRAWLSSNRRPEREREHDVRPWGITKAGIATTFSEYRSQHRFD
jgi:hypothetical protein